MRISTSFASLSDLSPLQHTKAALRASVGDDSRDRFAAAGGHQTAALKRRDALTYGSCNDMLTQHNDAARTGAAACETKLTPDAVKGGSFGKLFTRAVDGEIYAQPLYVSGVTIKGETKNVVVVATMNNSVYVFDADNADAQDPLWTINLGQAVSTTQAYGGSYKDALGVMGILSTPVIDKQAGLIYTVSAQQQGGSDTPIYEHVLTALHLNDGSVALTGAQIIAASVPGNSSDSVDGVLSFNSQDHIQRPALLLTQGQVLVAFGSHGDATPYHGWLMSYDATTLAQTGVYSTTTQSLGGSIWQSGQGLAVGPDGAIYGATANGFGSDPTQASERVESLVKWTLNPGVQFADSFTPSDYAALDASDLDFGSCGPIIPPNANRVISGGKDGKLYSVPLTNLGGLVTGDPSAQEVTASSSSLYGAPVYYNSATGPQLFIHAPGDVLKAFSFNNDLLSTSPVQQNPDVVAQAGVPGGILTVSTNGDDAASGIVWANLVASGNANQATQPGVLKAFLASDITQQLWSSDANSADAVGNFGKFVPPTVANGRVYLATFSNQLAVYGLAANAATNGTGATNGTSSVAPSSAAPSSALPSSNATSSASIAMPTSTTAAAVNSTTASATPSQTVTVTVDDGTGDPTIITTCLGEVGSTTGAALTTALPFVNTTSVAEVTVTAPTFVNSTTLLLTTPTDGSTTVVVVPTDTASDAVTSSAVVAVTTPTDVVSEVTVSTGSATVVVPVVPVVSPTDVASATSADAGSTPVVVPAGTGIGVSDTAAQASDSPTDAGVMPGTVTVTAYADCTTTPADLLTSSLAIDFTTLSSAVDALTTTAAPSDIFGFATLTSSLGAAPTDLSTVSSLLGSSTTAADTAVSTQGIGNFVSVASSTPAASTAAPVFAGAAIGLQMAPNLALAAVLVQLVRHLF